VFGDLNILKFMRCLFSGHDFRNSRAKPGMLTCTRCHYRRWS